MKNSKSLLWTFIKSTVVNCLIVIAFSGLFNGSLRIDKPIYGFYGALLLTILYMFIRPIILMVSIVIINALLIMFVSYLLSPHFEVASFGSAFFLAIFISIFNALLNSNDRKIIIKKF